MSKTENGMCDICGEFAELPLWLKAMLVVAVAASAVAIIDIIVQLAS